jgi:hypothetical protein
VVTCNSFIHQWLYSPLLGPGEFLSFVILFTVCRTPWTGDQLVARPLPTHRTAQTHTDMHASSGIRTHDPSVRAGEDSSCLRPHSRLYRHLIDRLVTGFGLMTLFIAHFDTERDYTLQFTITHKLMFTVISSLVVAW